MAGIIEIGNVELDVRHAIGWSQLTGRIAELRDAPATCEALRARASWVEGLGAQTLYHGLDWTVRVARQGES